MYDKILDSLRFVLYAAMAVIGFYLFQAWEKEHPHTPEPSAVSQVAPVNQSGRFVPETTISTAPAAVAATQPAPNASASMALPQTGKLVKVTTDVLEAAIDTRGGDVVQVKLLQYPESLHSKVPFLLLNNDPKTRYIAESGLISKMGPDTAQEQADYTVEHTDYTLVPGADSIVVNLHWQKNGVNVTKIYTFTRGSYEVKVRYELDNQSNANWEGNLYTQLLRTNTPPASEGGFINLATYFGAAISTPQKAFEKISFKQMHDKTLSVQAQDGWAAMIQHYFIGAWVPPKTATSTYYTNVLPGDLYVVGMIGSPLQAAPSTKIATETKLYTGPAIASDLEKTAPGLKLTIDYGWFWFISGIIFWLMEKIHQVVGNWGWSIVIVTVIIKILFYQLSAKSYRSMSMMKKLQPKIEKLKERYGDDKQKLTQATLELYREEKVNPMSGCLPILVQIPVFIALYWVLVESVQLRQAPFIFWIHDLSQHDPYYILPVLMGISMFIQQKLNPAPADPVQAKVMMLMPVIFTVLFANFPAGLMLYWFVNNTLSFLQQWYIMRRVDAVTAKKSK
jgi:YidC/Oxa1 family membrane protein insertase